MWLNEMTDDHGRLKTPKIFAVCFMGFWVLSFSFLHDVNHPQSYIELPTIEVSIGTDSGDTEFCGHPQKGSGYLCPRTRSWSETRCSRNSNNLLEKDSFPVEGEV